MTMIKGTKHPEERVPLYNPKEGKMELDKMIEEIAIQVYEFVHRGKTHMSWDELPFKWGKKQYRELATQILSSKTANGYSIREMIEFFAKIDCDTQREAVVKRKMELPGLPSEAEISRISPGSVTWERYLAAYNYQQEMLAHHFVEEVKDAK